MSVLQHMKMMKSHKFIRIKKSGVNCRNLIQFIIMFQFHHHLQFHNVCHVACAKRKRMLKKKRKRYSNFLNNRFLSIKCTWTFIHFKHDKCDILMIHLFEIKKGFQLSTYFMIFIRQNLNLFFFGIFLLLYEKGQNNYSYLNDNWMRWRV